MKTTTALTTLVAAAAVSAGAVTTADAVDGDTAVTVGPTKPLAAGATAPFDAPGVKAVRRGKPIPSGYVLVGRSVVIEAGTGAAGAAVRLTCPAGKVLRTLGATGDAGLQIERPYVGRQSTNITSFGNRGGNAKGVLYGVCR